MGKGTENGMDQALPYNFGVTHWASAIPQYGVPLSMTVIGVPPFDARVPWHSGGGGGRPQGRHPRHLSVPNVGTLS